MSSAAAARKAWNDAMKASAPTHIRGAARPRKRRSERRARTCKTSATTATSAAESAELQRSIWVDALEEVDAHAQDQGAAAGQDDDAYNEYEELDGGNDDDGDKAKSKKRRASRKAAPKKAAAAHKRFLPRSLGTILLEEANTRPDGVAQEFLRVQATNDGTPLPARNFCPVTGLPGLFRDPKSGIWYSSYAALEQIRERPPPWMALTGGSHATYYEAVKSIQESSSSLSPPS